MSEMPEALARKVGPLPAGAWLLVAVGGLAATFVLRRQGATPAAPEVAGQADWLDNTQPGAGNLGAGVDSNPVATAPAFPAPQTNEEWVQAVMRVLLGKGYDPLLVQTALSKYLAGDATTVQEKAVIASALVAVGAPPVLPPPAPPGQPWPTTQPGGITPTHRLLPGAGVSSRSTAVTRGVVTPL